MSGYGDSSRLPSCGWHSISKLSWLHSLKAEKTILVDKLLVKELINYPRNLKKNDLGRIRSLVVLKHTISSEIGRILDFFTVGTPIWLVLTSPPFRLFYWGKHIPNSH